jgi:hypothetical protein
MYKHAVALKALNPPDLKNMDMIYINPIGVEI